MITSFFSGKPRTSFKYIFIGYLGGRWPVVLVSSLRPSYVKGELA